MPVYALSEDLPMFHTLLVAIDGGPQTRRIAELARQAAAPGARVHLLCAVDAGYALPGRPTLLDYPPAAHECEEAPAGAR